LIYLTFICVFFIRQQFEADRRAINITINSFGTELSRDDRAKLFPSLGRLHPDGHAKLARADEIEHVKNVVEVWVVGLIIILGIIFVDTLR